MCIQTHAVVVRGQHMSIRADTRVVTDSVNTASDAAYRRIQLALICVCIAQQPSFTLCISSAQIVGGGEGLNPPGSFERPPSSGKFQRPRGVAGTLQPSSLYHFTVNEWFASYYHTSTANHHALHPMCTVIWASFGYKDKF